MVVPTDARPFLRDLNARAVSRRLQGLIRLAEKGDWTLQGLVAPHLDDHDRDVRIAALLALRAIGDRRWAPRALDGLGDDDPVARGASAALLAALGPSPEESDALLARAGDPDWEVTRALLAAARRPAGAFRDRLAAWLARAMDHGDAAVRRTAALLLETAPDPAHRERLETLRCDLAPAPFGTSALDAWLAERNLSPRPDPAARVATVSEAAGRALGALARRAKASALPAAGAYGWDVLFAYRRLPSATDVAAGVWPGLDIEGLDVQGETNPDGSHWTFARLAPRARAIPGGLRLTVARRDDLIGGRLLYAPDPRLPTLAALDARLAARPGADAAVLVEVDEPGGRHPDADRAARWVAEALDGLASGPWVREAP